MKIIDIYNRSPKLISQLTGVWEQSVKATHLFLSSYEIDEIKKYIPGELKKVENLVIAIDENKFPVGFMGVKNKKLEMLFISPKERGKGLGKQFIYYGIKKFLVNEVAVNEQNPKALGFYEHMGFKIYKRIDHDEQGRPYPLIYLKL